MKTSTMEIKKSKSGQIKRSYNRSTKEIKKSENVSKIHPGLHTMVWF
jgi:hypothetical protein